MSRLRIPDLPRSLVVRRVVALDNRVEIEVGLRKRSVLCPDCQCPTQRIHSFYQRKLADLPWQGRPATLIVSVPRFFCQAAVCPRRTFVMPLDGITVRHGRQTTRLTDLHYYIAHTLGGSAGARMTVRLCCPISPDTLIRRLLSRVRNTRKDTPPTRVVGVDDWAWRRGHHYGTIVVDLEKNDVIDLLPDREAATLAQWLQAHPGVEIIARDRAGAYADGCHRGAPSALQVTDRWHLLKNLSEAFVSILGRFTTTVRTLTRQLSASTTLSETSGTVRTQPEEAQTLIRSVSGERRETLFNEALALKAEGHSIQAIATTIGVERKTVRRWFQRGHAPTWKRTVPTRSILGPYISHLEKRWVEGCRNIRQLWRELLEQGFTGKYGTVRKWVTTRQGISTKPVSSAYVSPPLGRKLARLLLADDPLSAGRQDGLLVPALLEAEPQLAVTLCWLRKMQNLLCKKEDTRKEGDLKALLEEGKTTLLSRLIPALERDAAAIEASLVTPWTTSPVEGQISRLKMIKRTMFGRAGFELLRARVLQPA
ncbi:MAG: ISL3 family transposase [Acetobacter aceti]|nr:transposase [Komagataeibacter xylinus]EGG75096.1 transposase [Gluconacetobacter sp. SXCC-1]ATU72307.1 transposase [Komagataeibacter xylinus]ATU72704.1 transposase [Komagataeibacter xylinus]ATU72966.1 transposase [Komagataeibacter xylinus]